MNDGLPLDERVSLLAEEYLSRKRRGEPVQLCDLLLAYPDLADEIEDYVHLLELMERDVVPGTSGAPKLERLGDYRIECVVGQGGMGVVCRAVQESLGRPVALKLMRSVSREPASVARFQREARAAA